MKSCAKTLLSSCWMFQEVLVASVYLLVCVFEGEKRGLGGNALFFLAGSCLLGHSSRNHKMTNFPASLSFFPLSVCVAHVLPLILAPLGWRRRDMGGVTCVCRNICVGTFCLSCINIHLEIGLSLGALYPSSSSLRGVLHQTLPPCSAMPVRPIVNSHNSEFGRPGPFFSPRFAIDKVQTTPGMWHCVIVYGCFKWQFEALVAL